MATVGIGPNKVVLDFVSLGFKHLKHLKTGKNCTELHHCDTNFKQEASSSSTNRAKPRKFVYALFRDYRHTPASRLLESETRSQ